MAPTATTTTKKQKTKPKPPVKRISCRPPLRISLNDWITSRPFRVTKSQHTRLYKDTLKVWTDGGCWHNGKEDAIAGIGVFFGEEEDERNVGRPLGPGKQTNQRAELMAIKVALDTASIHQNIEIRTDSMFSIRAITTLFPKWEMFSWSRPAGIQIPHEDLIRDIRDRIKRRALVSSTTVFWWVKGHSDDWGNEVADHLATIGIAMEKRRRKLAKGTVSNAAADKKKTSKKSATDDAVDYMDQLTDEELYQLLSRPSQLYEMASAARNDTENSSDQFSDWNFDEIFSRLGQPDDHNDSASYMDQFSDSSFVDIDRYPLPVDAMPVEHNDPVKSMDQPSQGNSGEFISRLTQSVDPISIQYDKRTRYMDLFSDGGFEAMIGPSAQVERTSVEPDDPVVVSSGTTLSKTQPFSTGAWPPSSQPGRTLSLSPGPLSIQSPLGRTLSLSPDPPLLQSPLGRTLSLSPDSSPPQSPLGRTLSLSPDPSLRQSPPSKTLSLSPNPSPQPSLPSWALSLSIGVPSPQLPSPSPGKKRYQKGSKNWNKAGPEMKNRTGSAKRRRRQERLSKNPELAATAGQLKKGSQGKQGKKKQWSKDQSPSKGGSRAASPK